LDQFSINIRLIIGPLLDYHKQLYDVDDSSEFFIIGGFYPQSPVWGYLYDNKEVYLSELISSAFY